MGARSDVVVELLKDHPSGDTSLDLQILNAGPLVDLARKNGYPAGIITSIVQRAEKSQRSQTNTCFKRPASVMSTAATHRKTIRIIMTTPATKSVECGLQANE